MHVVGSIQSVLEGELARVYRVKLNKKILICKTFVDGRFVAVSFYIKSIVSIVGVRVFVLGPYSSQSQDFNVGLEWKRCVVSLRNDISLQPLKIFLTFMGGKEKTFDVSIAFLQVEKGLLATSVILPDNPLPCINHSRQAYKCSRAADRLSFSKDASGVSIDSKSSSVSLLVKLIPRKDQIADDQVMTILSFWSSIASREVSLCVSGANDSAYILRDRKDSGDMCVVTSVIASDNQYHVCIIFDNNIISVVINGLISLVYDMEEYVEFDNHYIGCSHGNQIENMYGYVQKMDIYRAPLIYQKVLKIYKELCPDHNHYMIEYMIRYYRFSLISDDEIFTYNACINDNSFSFFTRQIEFSIPEIYSQFSTGKKFVEENVRDYVFALLKTPNLKVSRENYSKIGRTDLCIYYDDNLDGDLNQRVHRIEFKIWGSSGYNLAPSQPLKYMKSDELSCTFVMIDRRKNPNIDDFVNVVQNNSEYPCVSIKEIPLLESDLKYFVSFHRDARYRSLRMVINIYLLIKS